jgi:hypothetical protein
MVKAVVILGAIVLVSWLVFGLGAVGGRHEIKDIVADMQRRFGGVMSAPLAPSDLEPVDTAGCAVADGQLVVARASSCAFDVREGGMRARRAAVSLPGGRGSAQPAMAPSDQTRPKTPPALEVLAGRPAPVAFYSEGGTLTLVCADAPDNAACRFRLEAPA